MRQALLNFQDTGLVLWTFGAHIWTSHKRKCTNANRIAEEENANRIPGLVAALEFALWFRRFFPALSNIPVIPQCFIGLCLHVFFLPTYPAAWSAAVGCAVLALLRLSRQMKKPIKLFDLRVIWIIWRNPFFRRTCYSCVGSFCKTLEVCQRGLLSEIRVQS